MASRLGVKEVNRETHDDQHNDEDEVVFPPDPLERDRVDEGVEEDGDDGRREGYDEAARAQTVGPNFAGVGCLEGGPVF